MPEPEYSQEPEPHFHKKIPSIFGKSSVIKSPQIPPGGPSIKPLNIQNIMVGLLFGVVVLIGTSSTTFFYLKLRQSERERKFNEEEVNKYRRAILEIQKEAQAKAGGEEINHLKLELEKLREKTKETEEERDLLNKKLESSLKELEKERSDRQELQKNLQETKKTEETFQEQINKLKLENLQLQEKIKNLKSREMASKEETIKAEELKGHIIVVKPEVRIGVIDLGSRNGITPEMILGIYDKNNQRIGEFLVDEVEELFSAGRIRAEDVKRIKPGMQVCKE